MDKIRILVTHPRTCESFEADVAPACPARTVLEGLQRQDTGPFLDPAPAGRPYALVLARTGRQLTPNTSMGEAGVVAGDQLEVQQMGQGA